MYSSVLAALPKRPVSEILRDLDAVRTARKEAEAEEAHARAKREQLQIEEATLVQLVALTRLAEGGNRDQGVLLVDSEGDDVDMPPNPRQHMSREEELRRVLLSQAAWRYENAQRDAGADIAAGNAVVQVKAKPRPFSKRPAILRIMQDHPEQEWWATRDIRRRLAELGIDASINLVGITMRRMERAGELVRDEGEPRFFKLTPDGEATSMGAG